MNKHECRQAVIANRYIPESPPMCCIITYPSRDMIVAKKPIQIIISLSKLYIMIKDKTTNDKGGDEYQ